MSYTQPIGYRLAGAVNLPALSRALERGGWDLWRAEVTRALATVCLAALQEGEDAAYARLSHGQISRVDLRFSAAVRGALVCRAAEFLDRGHALMAHRTTIPMPPELDLRCRAQFMDDLGDPDGTWTYVLFGTQHLRLVEAFEQVEGLERYPVDLPGVTTPSDPERAAVWERVLAPFGRSQPLAVSAPDPEVLFDVFESLTPGNEDVDLEAAGRVTVTGTLAQLALMAPHLDPAVVSERVLSRPEE